MAACCANTFEPKKQKKTPQKSILTHLVAHQTSLRMKMDFMGGYLLKWGAAPSFSEMGGFNPNTISHIKM